MRGSNGVQAACLLLIIVAPNGVSVNPLDDDAGSGGDAGDVFQTAVPIEPGAYEGRLMGPNDRLDLYRFAASEGDLLRLRWDGPFLCCFVWLTRPGDPDQNLAEGNLYAAFQQGQERTVVLTESGAWYLRVQRLDVALSNGEPTQGPVGESAYEFAWSLERPVDAFIHRPEGLWEAYELRSSNWSTLHVSVRAQTPRQWTEPVSVLAYLEERLFFRVAGDLVYAGSGYGYFRIYGSRLSEWVSVAPGPLEPQHIPIPPSGLNGTAGGTQTSVRAGVVWERLVVYRSSPEIRLTVDVHSDGPFERARAGGDDLLLWSERNSGSDTQVLTPAAHVAGARDLAVDSPTRLLGWFDGWGSTGSLETPAGERRDVGPIQQSLFVRDGRSGRWNFHLDPNSGVGVPIFLPDGGVAPATGTTHNYLDLVQVPALGLVPLHLNPEFEEICDPAC